MRRDMHAVAWPNREIHERGLYTAVTTEEKGSVQLAPDRVKLNQIQLGRLSRLSGVPAKELEDQSVAAIQEKFRWRINPTWLLFERVCGRVVKLDTHSGLKYPVPGATVNVFDVDCDWLWYFPIEWPWAWAFPFGFCRRELLATTTTDACGNFCVWVPRFDIDWILTWRRERICLPDLFKRPSIADILSRVSLQGVSRPPFPPDPNPPDPAALLAARADVATALGSGVADRIRALASDRFAGAPSTDLNSLMSGRAFTHPVPPPVHHELRRRHVKGEHQALAEQLNVDASRLESLRFDNYSGPFLRCFDVFFPEWLPILEVPDITFQVTQDTDGDGDQEVIYDGAFDVPWTLPVADVELDVADFALALPSPGCAPDFPCTDVAAIQMVGLMPIDPGFVNPTTGFATRPNRARVSGHQSGTPTNPSTAPFARTLQLYGCVHHIGTADRYRIMAEFASGDGLSGTPAFGSAQPLRETWHVYRFSPFVDQLQQPDADGWYPILDDTWNPLHLLMNWNSGAMGSYRLTLQLGHQAGAIVNHLSDAAPVVLFVDNNAPTVQLNVVRWWEVSGTGPEDLPAECPLIRRHPGKDIQVQVDVTVSAPHLRNVVVSASGCGSGATVTPSSVDHWHQNEFDNAWTNSTIYTIPASAPAGCYAWSVTAVSRAFNPSGDNNGLGVDWLYDPTYIYVVPSKSVAITTL